MADPVLAAFIAAFIASIRDGKLNREHRQTRNDMWAYDDLAIAKANIERDRPGTFWGQWNSFEDYLERSNNWPAVQFREGDDRYVATAKAISANEPRIINGGFSYGGPDWGADEKAAVRAEFYGAITAVTKGAKDGFGVLDVIKAGVLGAAVAAAGNAVWNRTFGNIPPPTGSPADKVFQATNVGGQEAGQRVADAVAAGGSQAADSVLEEIIVTASRRALDPVAVATAGATAAAAAAIIEEVVVTAEALPMPGVEPGDAAAAAAASGFDNGQPLDAGPTREELEAGGDLGFLDKAVAAMGGVGDALDIIGRLTGIIGSLQAAKNAKEEGKLRADINKKGALLDKALAQFQLDALGTEEAPGYEQALNTLWDKQVKLYDNAYIDELASIIGDPDAEEGSPERLGAVGRLDSFYAGKEQIRTSRGTLAFRTLEEKASITALLRDANDAQLGADIMANDALGELNLQSYAAASTYYGKRKELRSTAREQTGQQYLLNLADRSERARFSLEELDATTSRDFKIYGTRFEQSLLAQARSEDEADELLSLGAQVRERQASETIIGLGQQAIQQAGSGLSFSSSSLADRRKFYQQQAAKDSIRELTQVKSQSAGKRTQAARHGMDAEIAAFNLDHINWERTARSSNIRLLAAIETGVDHGQLRELSLQDKLLESKRLTATGSADASREELSLFDDGEGLRAESGLASPIDNPARIAGLDFSYFTQFNQLALQRDIQYRQLDEQATGDEYALARAGIDRDRTSVQLSHQRSNSRLRSIRETISLLGQDEASIREYNSTVLDLDGSRLSDNYNYDERNAGLASDRLALDQAHAQQSLNVEKGRLNDDYQLGNRRAALEHALAQATLQEESGILTRHSADSAALNSYLSAIGGLIDAYNAWRPLANDDEDD